MSTFGDYLRACRLGYRYHADLKCYLRLGAPPPTGPIVAELAPPGKIPGVCQVPYYAAWWEGPDVISHSPALVARYGRVSDYEVVLLDEDGNEVARAVKMPPEVRRGLLGTG